MTAKTLMIQGTGSGVGKSLLTAAFCRHFYLEGWRVAPFKAQNMSLNAFVTEDGGEIGRAQSYQAEACGLAPHVTMNPILLKPLGDNASQVIVMGRPVGVRNARDYYAQHDRHRQAVQNALEYLRRGYDLVILEGAGSPAEINLKPWDLVNMPMAEMAEAPVLIVGDIDRGGVFAWMKGTFDLLTPEEQDRVGGFLINKFRGDPGLLEPGLKQFENRVGRPVLGVLPYCRDLFIDEEDAIPAREHPAADGDFPAMDAAVLWFPHIANFTDVSPLAVDPAVHLRYVTHPAQLGDPDLIVVPGSKNTVEDMRFLKDRGLDRAVRESHRNGSLVLGICGGLQILGRAIEDPHHLESRLERIDGLGFFDYETRMVPEKVTRQIRRTTCLSPVFQAGLPGEGYEIHHGITRFPSRHVPLFAGENGEDPLAFGLTDEAGTVVGTYLHGFLDRDEIREAFLNHVRKQRGRRLPESPFRYQEFKRRQLDGLAELVRNSVDMNRIRKLIDGTE